MATVPKTDKKPHLYRDSTAANARPEDRICARCGVVEWMDKAKEPCPGSPANRNAFSKKELAKTRPARRRSGAV